MSPGKEYHLMSTIQQRMTHASDLVENQRGKLSNTQKLALLRYYAKGFVWQLLTFGLIAGVWLFAAVTEAQKRGEPFSPAGLIIPVVFLLPLLYSLTIFAVGIGIGKVSYIEGTLSYMTRRSRRKSFTYLMISDDRGKTHKFHCDDRTYYPLKVDQRVRVYYVWLIHKALRLVDAI
jgi:hypothetical protein